MKKKVARDGEKVASLQPHTDGHMGLPSRMPGLARAAQNWAENVVAGGSSRRVAVLVGSAGLCLCMYALLISFSSVPCWHSVHCSKSSIILSHATETQFQSHGKHNSQTYMQQAQISNYQPRSLPTQGRASKAIRPLPSRTNLSHIVFGIAASSRLWNKRKEYIKLWWKSHTMRGYVWLDENVNKTSDDRLPPLKISPNTSHFRYTNRLGRRSAIRISRIVSDTFRLGLPDVHWFVMGDDDTVFIPENLVSVLSKYDHRQYYYIGSNSESHLQNLKFTYNMAYGGGGFAISYPLAQALHDMHDSCLHRYPDLFGSDDRIQACMAELGVPLMKEPGFHQFDIYGNLFGLLAAHPIAPAVSLHHVDVVEPIFPNKSRLQALRHLHKAIRADPSGVLQQSICYDPKKQWSISVSWGFAVQVYRGILLPRELEIAPRTFYNWYRKADHTAYAFNTRAFSRNPCQKPFIFYLQNVSNRDGQTVSFYGTDSVALAECKWKMASPETVKSVKVVKQRDDNMWSKGPRRKCCHVAGSSEPATSPSTLEIEVRDCELGEIAAA